VLAVSFPDLAFDRAALLSGVGFSLSSRAGKNGFVQWDKLFRGRLADETSSQDRDCNPGSWRNFDSPAPRKDSRNWDMYFTTRVANKAESQPNQTGRNGCLGSLPATLLASAGNVIECGRHVGLGTFPFRHAVAPEKDSGRPEVTGRLPNRRF